VQRQRPTVKRGGGRGTQRASASGRAREAGSASKGMHDQVLGGRTNGQGGGGGVRMSGPRFPRQAPTSDAARDRGTLEIGDRGVFSDSGLGWVGVFGPLWNKDFYFPKMDFESTHKSIENWKKILRDLKKI
jgi:hypothetical protein